MSNSINSVKQAVMFTLTITDIDRITIECIPPKEWVTRYICVIRGGIEFLYDGAYILSAQIDAKQECWEELNGYNYSREYKISNWVAFDIDGIEHPIDEKSTQLMNSLACELAEDKLEHH